jgi:predicted ATPase
MHMDNAVPSVETATAPIPDACECDRRHPLRRVVLTGGPGAGKTAVLELVRVTACRHVRVLPEAASVVFGGGFPRRDGFDERRAAQRAIFHVQRELEALGEAEDAAILLCDRGTLDGLAYWPGDPDELWAAVHANPEAELMRYAAVIHLRTPGVAHGYNHVNPIRTESADDAALIDARIAEIWSAHPRLTTIAASMDFLTKADKVLEALRVELPDCCRQHAAPISAVAG